MQCGRPFHIGFIEDLELYQCSIVRGAISPRGEGKGGGGSAGGLALVLRRVGLDLTW